MFSNKCLMDNDVRSVNHDHLVYVLEAACVWKSKGDNIFAFLKIIKRFHSINICW